jgi:NAD+ synthase (glutamine-hydrolysing)
MAHYSVNASVPKTLIQHLIRWVAGTERLGSDVSGTLEEILATEISPELIPDDASDGRLQSSEAIVGPYELQDFNLYYTLRFGFAPSRVAFLAYCAWRDRQQGAWPDIPPDHQHEYDLGEIKRHLGTFLFRFFQLSQYKRSALPNAPKVGSGGSLSPRGDYRAPSDAEAAAWLRQLEGVPERGPGSILLNNGDPK